MRLPESSDSRLLLAGGVALVVLIVYLAVAFATTHISAFAASPTLASKVAPWTPHDSNLFPLRRRGIPGYVVHVTPAKEGVYGALAPSVYPSPPDGRKFVLILWLRGARPGRIGVTLDEFAPGATSVYLVNTTVPATRRWHAPHSSAVSCSFEQPMRWK